MIDDSEELEEDGSNWPMWIFKIGRLIEYISDIEDYMLLRMPSIRTPVALIIDRCALDVIRRTLPANLNDEIATCVRAHAAKFRLHRFLDPYGMSKNSFYNALGYWTDHFGGSNRNRKVGYVTLIKIPSTRYG